jgi:hypothetical protein
MTSPLTRAFWACRHTTRRATVNTARCLVGCTVGDLGTLIALQVYCPSLGPEVTVPISCAAGISTSLALESTLLALGKDKMPARVAVRTAFNMSFISMLAMELAENAVEISLTGGTFESAASFLALVPATAAGFFAAYPYNFYMLRRHGRSCH